MIMAGSYPKRPTHFAHKFCRILMRACAAQDIGPEACYMLVQIAHTEDAARYRRGVRFFNDQLVHVAGVSNVKALQRAREKAVEAGWLHYEPGARKRPAVYWVTIPAWAEELSDAGMDEEPDEIEDGCQGENDTLSVHNPSTMCPQSVHNPSTVCPTIYPTPNPISDTDTDTEASPGEDETDEESHWADEHPDVADEASEPVEPIKTGKLDATSVYAGMTPDVVRSPTTVVSWFRRQLSAKAPVLAPTRADLLLAVCASLKASEPGSEKPVGVFVDLIKHHRWRAVKRYRDRAEEIIKKELSRDLARSN